jgi:3-deoxy-7-phosphoheptulonate synthase
MKFFMIYNLTLDPHHPEFNAWFSHIKKSLRPCINHSTCPTQAIIETNHNIDLGHPSVLKFEKKDKWPCLTDKTFMPENPCAIKFPLFIGGPCSLESKEQITKTIEALRPITTYIRAGIYKPRTNAHQFQGLGLDGIDIISQVKNTHEFNLVSEVTCASQIPSLSKICTAFQVGTRNMNNSVLLKALGQCDMPVVLKRSMCATYDEWLQSAEYIIREGNPQVILCERGIRTFETATRNTFDINAIAFLKTKTMLPVIADSSHGTGRSTLVDRVGMAAIAAGADGLLIEAHPQPDQSITDRQQALSLEQCQSLFMRAKSLIDFLE